MTPVTLHLEYFGPYRDATIDFTRFMATPLFLISGKTGSGKTTIFDGMCYALFDQTSGTDRKAPAMRSDFATAADRTRVTFTFTHRDRRYEIIREPAQTLNKKRGQGLTDVAAAVTLTVYADDREVTQLTKTNQVRDYLQELLQMDGKQFSQIVLLPQGQFRQFLIAPSEEKAAVLEQLFNTEIFARWTEQLKQRLKKDQATSQTTAAEVTRLLASLQWTSENKEAAQALIAAQRPEPVVTLMTTQQATTREQQAQLERRLATAQATVDRLVRQDEQEQGLLKDRQQLTQYRRQATELAQQAPAMDDLQTTITALEWVQTRQPAWQEREQAQQAQQQRQADQQQAQQDLMAAQTALKQAQAAVEQHQTLSAKITATTETLAQWRALEPIYRRVATLEQELKQAQQIAEKRQIAYRQAQTAWTTNQQAQTQQRAILDQQAEIYARQTKLLQQANDLTDAQSQAATLQQQVAQQADLTQQISQITERLQAAQSAAQTAHDLAAARYQIFLRQQIVTLSAQLTPGTPCPVCGSTTHPQPAQTTATETATEDDVKRAQDQATHATQQADQLAAQLTTLQQQLSANQQEHQTALQALRAQLSVADTMDLAAMTAILTQRCQEQQQAEQVNQEQRAALKQAQTQITQLTEAAVELQAKVTQTQQAVQQQNTTVDKLATTLTTEQQRLPADASTRAEYLTRVQKLQDQLAADQQMWTALEQQCLTAQQTVLVAQDRLTTATKEVTQSDQRVARAQAALAAQLAHPVAPLATDTEAQVARWLPQVATLPAKREQLQTFQAQQARLAALTETLSKRLQGQAKPDREATQAALIEANQTVIVLREQERQLKNLLEQNEQAMQQLRAVLDQQAAALQQTQELTELAGVVNGDGPNSKLGLERYVLQTYLRQILTVGNQRFQQLTNGRYQFVIDETPAASKKRSGLEINVYDDHVGEQRSVHTLSGGESFIASLALALALGEVIQQTTGSVDVDALFIDEGFGSLDEDALMIALESLETIEGRHRMIGIISHVSELRDQVANQLQVIANGNGESTIRYHATD
ncbi:SMC family ATPase [Levilactobacillus brevis]|uniref:AAA family ATPase n=1 Tax=Levilactobacillus brevis TaxID=1580 RepID=UPI000464B406|nr:SMC family ATPase [Levilactobacillus brevis]ARQ92610.1 DNA repair ATPase [Levilactobacillus brevis]MBU5275099.1 SMC family ATPase [Levilactobacillus brevis]QCZ56341.1 DNA repair ATPase [Levilactobacillus brevis]